MIKTRLKFVVYDPDRHGKPRYYVRKRVGGKMQKVRIRAPLADSSGAITEEFMAAYRAALEALEAGRAEKAPVPREDTFAWLWDTYQRSPTWAAFDKATQRDKRSVLNRFLANIDHLPYRKFRRQDVVASQTKRAHTPAAADKLVKYLRAWFGWAIEQEYLKENPAADVPKIHRTKGWHTWTKAEVEKYREKHPIGTLARVALELMLQVGARISDAARLGRQHETDGVLSFTAYKNRNRSPVQIDVPIRDELREALSACNQVGDLTYLVTEAGASFTIKGLGNKFREWCDEAGLKHCSAHGLRKAAATALAENGCTALELMAIFGWSRMETAEVYVKAANRKRMAARGIARLDEHRTNKSVSLRKAKTPGETKRGKKH